MREPNRNWRRWVKAGREVLERIPLSDFHMHTTWTDGRCTVRDYLTTARCLGLEAIAITEHVGLHSHWYADFAAEVEAVRQESDGIELFSGIEVAAWDYQGNLKTSAELLRQADLVIGVVHRYPAETGGPREFRDIERGEALRCELKALASLARNKNIHILGHPGGTFAKKYGPFAVGFLAPIFRIAKANGVAVELSAKYTWDWENMLDVLWDVNPLVSIGSDAHTPNELGRTHREVSDPLLSFKASSKKGSWERNPSSAGDFSPTITPE